MLVGANGIVPLAALYNVKALNPDELLLAVVVIDGGMPNIVVVVAVLALDELPNENGEFTVVGVVLAPNEVPNENDGFVDVVQVTPNTGTPNPNGDAVLAVVAGAGEGLPKRDGIYGVAPKAEKEGVCDDGVP